MYLTFSEYSDLGGSIEDEVSFTQAEFKARKIIDSYTANRVSAMQEVPDAVKRCIYELIQLEMIYDSGVSGLIANATGPSAGKLVASFTNDGYSETYSNGASNAGEYLFLMRKNTDKAQSKTVKDYLAYEYDDNGVPLLYKGVK